MKFVIAALLLVGMVFAANRDDAALTRCLETNLYRMSKHSVLLADDANTCVGNKYPQVSSQIEEILPRLHVDLAKLEQLKTSDDGEQKLQDLKAIQEHIKDNKVRVLKIQNDINALGDSELTDCVAPIMVWSFVLFNRTLVC